MITKRTNTSISLTLGITSILIITTIFLIGILNDWNLSPPSAHVMGILLIASMIISIVGLVFFMVTIKKSVGLKPYLAGALNLTSILIILGLIFKWY